MPSANGRVALVTGASRGIGAEIAKRLASDGYAVIVNYSGSKDRADEVTRAITEAGGQAVAVQADTSDPAAVRNMFDITERTFGGLDLLVSNAGIQIYASVATMSDEDFDRTVAVNLKGVFNTLREAARRIRQGGTILTLSSGTTQVLPPELSAYAASKSAVETLTKVLAKELRGRDVTVNCVAPGPVATELFLQGKSPELLAAMAARSPHGRIGVPTDIASAVAMLAGPDARWIHGQVILVNGGFA